MENRTELYRGTPNQFTHTMKRSPDSAVSHDNLGVRWQAYEQLDRRAWSTRYQCLHHAQKLEAAGNSRPSLIACFVRQRGSWSKAGYGSVDVRSA